MSTLVLKIKIWVYKCLNFLYSALVGHQITRTRPYMLLFLMAVILAILLFGAGAFFLGFLS